MTIREAIVLTLHARVSASSEEIVAGVRAQRSGATEASIRNVLSEMVTAGDVLATPLGGANGRAKLYTLNECAWCPARPVGVDDDGDPACATHQAERVAS